MRLRQLRTRVADRVLAAATDWKTRGQLQEEVGCSRKQIVRVVKHLLADGRLWSKEDPADRNRRRLYRAAP